MHKEGRNSQPKLCIASLGKQTAFDLVNKNGKKLHGRFFILIGMPGDPDASGSIIHLGLKISKKMGGAVVRNKIRRRFKSLVRSTLKEIEIQKWSNWTFVFIPRRGLESIEYRLLETEMFTQVTRAVGQ